MIMFSDPTTTRLMIESFRDGYVEELPRIMNIHFNAPEPTDLGQTISRRIIAEFLQDVSTHPAAQL